MYKSQPYSSSSFLLNLCNSETDMTTNEILLVVNLTVLVFMETKLDLMMQPYENT